MANATKDPILTAVVWAKRKWSRLTPRQKNALKDLGGLALDTVSDAWSNTPAAPPPPQATPPPPPPPPFNPSQYELATAYLTLGVLPSATDDEVKRAYRERAKQNHPDRGGTDVQMAALNKAYETIQAARR